MLFPRSGQDLALPSLTLNLAFWPEWSPGWAWLCPCLHGPGWHPGSQACPCLSAPVFTQDGYGPPSPVRKQESMFCQWRGGVGGLSGSRPAPQQGRQWAGSLLLLEWRAGSPAPVSSSCPSAAGWRAGEEAPGLRAPAEPPVTTREQWPGGAGGWVQGQPSMFHAPTSNRDRLRGGLLPFPCLVFHLVGHAVSHHGAKENSGLRKCLWAVAGVLQLWKVAEWGEGTREGPALHRLHSAWDCS